MAEFDVSEEAGKVLGQMEQLANRASKKAQSAAEKLKRAYLLAEAKNLVMVQIVVDIEEGTEMGQDQEGFGRSRKVGCQQQAVGCNIQDQS